MYSFILGTCELSFELEFLFHSKALVESKGLILGGLIVSSLAVVSKSVPVLSVFER